MYRHILIALALLIGAVVASPASAETRWQNFGDDPAYATRAAAIADVPRVLREAGYSEEVVQAFTEEMRRSPEGTTVRLTNGERLEFMRTGKTGIWRDVLVDFRSPTVRGMEYAAPAQEWRVTVDGVTYVLGIPEVCNNIYLYRANADCVELMFNAPVGSRVHWGMASTNGPFSPDVCNAQRQGDGDWYTWWGECPVCVPDVGYIRQQIGGDARVYNRYNYPVTSQRQVLRFSREVWRKLVWICIEYPDGSFTYGVYMTPSEWRDRMRVSIPDNLWAVAGSR